MPFIENCAAADIPIGYHTNPGPRSVLIQITDPASWVPKPSYQFVKTYHFEFLDVEAKDQVLDPAMKISEQQAQSIAEILRDALANDMNVIVHCFAGVSRSGAVCQAGVALGFDDTGRAIRYPNVLVKNSILAALGLPYDASEQPVDWHNT
jgi:predicted protein tyrosine phosphatase